MKRRDESIITTHGRAVARATRLYDNPAGSGVPPGPTVSHGLYAPYSTTHSWLSPSGITGRSRPVGATPLGVASQHHRRRTGSVPHDPRT